MIEKKYILTKQEVLEIICKGIMLQRKKEDGECYIPSDLADEIFKKEMIK